MVRTFVRCTLLTDFKCTISLTYRHNVVQQVSTTYSSCTTETLCSLICPSHQPLTTTVLLSASMSLTISDTADEWNQPVLSFCDWLSSLTHVLQVHPHCHILQDFLIFLQLNNNSIGCIYHYLHSPNNRHMSYFFISWLLVNSAANKMGTLTSFWDPDFNYFG